MKESISNEKLSGTLCCKDKQLPIPSAEDQPLSLLQEKPAMGDGKLRAIRLQGPLKWFQFIFAFYREVIIET